MSTEVIVKVSLYVMAAALLAAAVASTTWHMTVDAPLLAYAALAIDKWGLVPYQDIFDFNTPGAYLANIAIGRVFGYSELGFRLADLTCLAMILSASAYALRGFGHGVAGAAVMLFGFMYLGHGPVMSLQREYFLLVPVAASLAAACHDDRPSRFAGTIGILLGIAITIKPQSALLLPIFGVWLAWDRPTARVRNRLAVGMTILAGAALPIAASGVWIWSRGGMPAFLDMASNYWPLYNELTGIRPSRIITGWDRWWWNAQRWILSRDLRHLLIVPALAGAWIAWRLPGQSREHRRRIALLVAVFVAFQLYPLTAGKFWGYHWLPAGYAATLLAALCFVPAGPARNPDLVAAMTVVMLTAQAPGALFFAREVPLLGAVRGSTATQIADEMRARLKPGDRVQPLDWTAGVVHALWLTNTPMATPFLYDFYFYHHVSHPYVQAMRRKLIADLEHEPPKLIIDSADPTMFDGPDTTLQFAELSDLLRLHYHAAVANERFVIYERNLN